jgi:hypothetical protein
MIGLLNKDKIKKCVKKYSSDHYCKRFTTFQHLITILYGVTSGCNSLRELCGGIVSYGNRISHCKFNYTPRRSSISDANKRIECAVFEDIYYDLTQEYLPSLSDSHKQLVIDKKVYAIDSTTISLFQPIFECVGRNPNNGKRKGGIKSHQKLDMQAGIPVKVYHSHAREHDSLFIQHQDVVNKGEVALFDKAYNNYGLFAKWNAQDTYFLTNLFDLPAEQIALLYKKRWEIELLFKKIKQNFPLQYFYGDNQNAIQIQIWITLIALLLISFMKRQLTKAWSFSNLVSLLQKHLFAYAKFTDFFNNVDAFAVAFVKNKDAPEALHGKIPFQ